MSKKIGFVPFQMARLWGTLMLLAALILLFVLPNSADHMPKGFFTPILYAQLLNDVPSAHSFLKEQSNPNFSSKMIYGNFLDFFFMLSYALFLFYFFRDAHRLLTRYPFYQYFKFTPLAIWLFDFLETVVLLYLLIQEKDKINEESLFLLKNSSFVKWAFLGGFLFYLNIWLPNRGKLYLFLKYLSFPLLFFAITAFIHPPYLFEIFALMVQVNFFLIYLLALNYRFAN